jgi:Lrp/AsnC family leucine-responsive transcriptional regulator
VDQLDAALLAELQRDARLSFNELSRRVHLSAPAVAERVRRLEESGALAGYHARVDLSRMGWSVLAFVRMSCYGPRCVLRDPEVETWPEVLEIHRVTGDECSILKVVAEKSIELEGLIDRLAAYGRPSSTLVLSSPLTWKPIAPAGLE